MTKLTSVIIADLEKWLGKEVFEKAHSQAMTAVGPNPSLELIVVFTIKQLLERIQALEAKNGRV